MEHHSYTGQLQGYCFSTVNSKPGNCIAYVDALSSCEYITVLFERISKDLVAYNETVQETLSDS